MSDHNFLTPGDESLADDLNKKRAVVSGRVVLLSRSTETRLCFDDLSPRETTPLSTTAGLPCTSCLVASRAPLGACVRLCLLSRRSPWARREGRGGTHAPSGALCVAPKCARFWHTTWPPHRRQPLLFQPHAHTLSHPLIYSSMCLGRTVFSPRAFSPPCPLLSSGLASPRAFSRSCPLPLLWPCLPLRLSIESAPTSNPLLREICSLLGLKR